MEYTFEIADEFINTIVEKELEAYIETLEQALNDYKEFPDKWIAIFSTNKEEDKKEIKKTLKAMKRVKALYTVGGNV